MREQACREKIHKTAELCKLSPETVAEIDRIAGFVKENPALTHLTTDAVKPLIAIPDKDKQKEAISIVEKVLNRKTPTGGIIKRRLTKPEIKKIVEKVLPSEKPKTEPCDESQAVSEVKPKPVNNAGNYQPGDLTRTNLPPQPSLAAQQKAKEPEFYNISEPAATPKTQTQIKKEKAERLDLAVDAFLSLMPSSKTRNNIKEIMEKFPQFTAQADVIDMALDFMNGKWKP